MSYADVLFILLGALFLADNALTLKVLALGGKEANPIIAKLMDVTSPRVALLVSKVAVYLVIGWLYLRSPSLFLPAAGCVIYIAVVAWNAVTLRKMQAKYIRK